MLEHEFVPATVRTALGRRVGFWSALLMGVTYLWFYAAFLLYSPEWNAPWPGIAAYASSFKPQPFLAWVIPSFLLPSIILVMMVSLYAWAAEDLKLWGLMAVIFAAVSTAVLVPFYYIQMVVLPYHLQAGTTDGLSLWLFAYHYPHNIFGAMEGAGWGVLAVALIFAAQVFRSGRLQHWISWTFVVLGVSCLGLFINPLFPLPTFLGALAGLAGVVSGVVGPILLAILLRPSQSGTMEEK